MDITFITDEYSQDFVLAAEFAAAAGLKAVELRSTWNRHCLDLSPAQVSLIKRTLADNGLTICVLDTFLFKCSWAEFSQQASRDCTKRYLDLAARLSAPSIRIFGFWSVAGPSLNKLVEQVLEVSDLCRPLGVTLLVENGTFTTVAEGRSLSRLLESIDRADVRALWDPANVRNGGWPESSASGLQALGRRIAHVHVKNPHKDPACDRLSYGPLTKGLVDWPEQIRLLGDIGYKGYLSLETHARPNRILPQSLLKFPVGDAFSEGGQPATVCMLTDLKAMTRRELAYGS